MKLISWKRILSVGVLVLLVFAVAKAATQKYREAEDAFRKETRAQREKLGMSPADAKTKYPTPEVSMAQPACVMPGATADITVRGRFSAGSRFFVENDNFEVVKQNVAPNLFRATVKAAPDIGPQSASIAVIQELTGQTATTEALVVGGRYEWTLQASNGWKIVARSKGTEPCPTGPNAGAYEVSFFRPGETAPFEKRDGRIGFSQFSRQPFEMSLQEQPSGDMEAYQALMQKMADRTLTDAQRAQLIKQLEAAQKQMLAGMEKVTDPAYVKAQAAERQRKEEQFGCRSIGLTVEAGKVTSGDMNCSAKIGRPTMTGTMTMIK